MVAYDTAFSKSAPANETSDKQVTLFRTQIQYSWRENTRDMKITDKWIKCNCTKWDRVSFVETRNHEYIRELNVISRSWSIIVHHRDGGIVKFLTRANVSFFLRNAENTICERIRSEKCVHLNFTDILITSDIVSIMFASLIIKTNKMLASFVTTSFSKLLTNSALSLRPHSWEILLDAARYIFFNVNAFWSVDRRRFSRAFN